QGRKALLRADSNGLSEDFHEWRKRVKDHWYHVRLLENLWTDIMKGYEKSLKHLETWLGDDHNLVLLQDLLTSHPERFGGQEEIDLCLELIADRQKELRKEAVGLGELVYKEKPRAFAQRMRGLWKTWKN